MYILNNVRNIFLAAVSVAAAVLMLAGCACTAENTVDIRAGVVAGLSGLGQQGLDMLDNELEQISDEMYRAAVDRELFEQVLNPALAWVEMQKSAAGTGWGTWQTTVNREGLQGMENDRYRLDELAYMQGSQGNIDREPRTTIRITDLQTNQIYDWDKLQMMLDEEMERLQDMRQDRLAARDAISDLMAQSSAQWQNWKVGRPAGNVCTVSGPGLGWEGGISQGSWIYDISADSLMPQNAGARALEQRLKGLL